MAASKPTMDDAVAALEKIAEAIVEIGVDKVAQTAGVPERIVRKFVRDVMASKNSDIRKITGAVKALAS
jgi:hypothetical protein